MAKIRIPTLKTEKHHGRPYLIVRELMRPAKNVKTEHAGWLTKGRIETTTKVNSKGKTISTTKKNKTINRADVASYERASLASNLTRKTLSEAKIIIDIMNMKVVKTRLDGDVNDILDKYLATYEDECKRAVAVWVETQSGPAAKAQLQTMLSRLQTA